MREATYEVDRLDFVETMAVPYENGDTLLKKVSVMVRPTLKTHRMKGVVSMVLVRGKTAAEDLTAMQIASSGTARKLNVSSLKTDTKIKSWEIPQKWQYSADLKGSEEDRWFLRMCGAVYGDAIEDENKVFDVDMKAVWA